MEIRQCWWEDEGEKERRPIDMSPYPTPPRKGRISLERETEEGGRKTESEEGKEAKEGGGGLEGREVKEAVEWWMEEEGEEGGEGEGVGVWRL